MITHKISSPRGLTLIELLVTIAVIAIMAALAVPNLNNFMRSNRMSSQFNNFVGALQLARSEAVKRGAHVVLCASDNQTTCDTTQWELGWIVFVDSNGTSTLAAPGTPAAGDIVRVGDKISANDTIRDSNNTGVIIYLPSGAAVTTSGNGTTFKLCDPGSPSESAATIAKRALAVNIKISGIIYKAADPDGDGTVNDYNNTNVTCP